MPSSSFLALLWRVSTMVNIFPGSHSLFVLMDTRRRPSLPVDNPSMASSSNIIFFEKAQHRNSGAHVSTSLAVVEPVLRSSSSSNREKLNLSDIVGSVFDEKPR